MTVLNQDFLNGAIPGLFFIYFRVFKQTLQFLQQIGVWKKSIQYTVPGFEPTTFVKWVSFHNLYYFQNILPKSTYSKAISFCVSRRVVNRRMNECCRTVFEIWFLLGSGCGGSVGRAVASNNRGLQFESSLWQGFFLALFNVNCIE